MKTRFRQGEVVRITSAPGTPALTEDEVVVVEVTGPNDEGTGWNVTVSVGAAGPTGSLVSVAESALESTGMVVDERGGRVPVSTRPPPEELRDRIELRLFTDIADGIAAARAAEEVERELTGVLATAAITIVAERHWAEPYNYEFAVTIEPLDDPVEALGWLVLMGDGGWIASHDDGWQFGLWWSGDRETEAAFLVPEVHSAAARLLPWGSPSRRPPGQRPLLAIRVRSELGEPGPGRSDAETGDEEP